MIFFYAVLRPLLAVLDGRLSSYRIEPNKIDKLRFSIQSQKDLLRETLKIIFLYKEELKLLLFESKDTSLEVFRENFIDEQVAISKEYIDHMQKVYPQLQTNVSPLFFRISSFYMGNNYRRNCFKCRNRQGRGKTDFV